MARSMLFPLMLLCAASPAAAQSVQPWPSIVATAPVAPNLVAYAEVTGRAASDTRSSQLETRVQIGYAVTRRLTAFAGWVHFENSNPGAPDTSENQAAVQINWAAVQAGRVRLSSRTRIEARFLTTDPDHTDWRLREQIRGTFALGGKRAPGLVLWTEPFLALNRTPAQPHDLDQLRNFAGVTIPLSRKADLELGYLNQRLYRAHDTLVNHAIPLILTYRF